MRPKVLGFIAAGAPALPAAAHDAPHDDRRMDFPKAVSGGEILAVDQHTHSVFSDGQVWPSIRVEGAKRDGLAAMAVTEHLEYQPHAADIPHPDRNRSSRRMPGPRWNGAGLDARFAEPLPANPSALRSGSRHSPG